MRRPRLQKSRLARIERPSLADQARDQIRHAIFEGRIKPEEKLTIERIASDLGISRTPVREALKALEADGVLRILPRRGAVVERFDRQQLHERYTIRALLEGFAGELACAAQPPGLADALLENCAQLAVAAKRADPDDLQQVKRLVSLNRDFHQAILGASNSPIVTRILDGLVMPTGFRVYYWRAAERQSASIDIHLRIAQAFKARRAKDVRRFIESHLLEARDYLLDIGSEADGGAASAAGGRSAAVPGRNGRARRRSRNVEFELGTDRRRSDGADAGE